VVGAAVLFSTGGAAIKATGLEGIRGGLEVASLRSGIAAIFLAVAFPPARRGWSARTWAVGVAYALTVVLFVLANKQTTSAAAIFLQSAAPLYVLLAGVVILRERVRRPDVIVMLVLAAGLALFVADPGEAVGTAPRPALGNALAALSGVTWAATLVGLRGMGRGEGGIAAAAGATVAGNLIAFAACLPFGLPPAGNASDWALLAYLGVVQIALAYLLLTAAVRHVAAFEVSLLLLAEPALNPVWSLVVHGEVPGGLAVAGGALILGGTAAKVLLDRRRAPGDGGAGGGPPGAPVPVPP
jgi:DME family drug/metabolite transporter